MSDDFAQRSLRANLTRRVAIALAAIGTVAAVSAYFVGSRYANLAYDRALFDDVALLSEQVEFTNGAIGLNLPDIALKWLLADEGERVIYRVTDLAHERVIASNGDLGAVPRDATVVGQAYYHSVRVGETSYRVAYSRHLVDHSARPVLIEIGETLGRRDEMARGILFSTILLMATMIVVAVGLVWRGVGSALAPLRNLEHEAATRSGANLTPLDLRLAPLEVRALIEAINRMMERVSETMLTQRRFIANAAHQLRTPVAGLRLQAQIAFKATSFEAARSGIGEVELSAARASHLIEQLLTLSKAESLDLIASSLRVDLSEVAQEVIERYLLHADRRGIDLGFEGSSENVTVAGNEVLLAELVGNLVDNAIRYCQEGGRVTVMTVSRGTDVILSVSDNGPGFPQGVGEVAFQRFYRPDSSPRGGAGLGLAIVKEIADRYRGRLVLDSTPQGTTISVHFSRELI